MYTIVLLRHGESTWNKENRFTGWTDVDLSEKGRGEARNAGSVMREAGYTFDIAFTSVLKRAIRTLWRALDEMDLMWIDVVRSWRASSRVEPCQISTRESPRFRTRASRLRSSHKPCSRSSR